MNRHALLPWLLLTFACAVSAQQRADWTVVQEKLGRAGTLQGDIYKVGFPRTDLVVHVGKTRVSPAAALGSWMAFRQDASGAVVDGDLVLLQAEVNPVVSALEEHGLEVTAIHNHLLDESPRLMYVHFFARGDLGKLAEGLKAALSQTRTPMGPQAASHPAISFDRKSIETNLGTAGTVNGDVLAFAFPRQHRITMHGVEMAPAMGMATAVNFQASSLGVAATGDFVLREGEVNRVISALRAGGALVTAVHNHMLEDDPRTVFVHFWAEGAPDTVSKTLRQALDAAR